MALFRSSQVAHPEFYAERIQPKLLSVSSTVIATTVSVSIPYATDIRKGKRTPHPRHWQILAHLVNVPSVS